jgi:NADPH:quinone reductase-like Zn-dependent oxidoreductase
MKAWTISRHGGPEALELQEVELPRVGTEHTRVKVEAVGLNHLDLWVRKGVEGHTFPLPIIPGCDVAGKLENGQRVLVNPILSCGQCEKCKKGLEPLCKKFGLLGETTNGGCADFIVAPTENILPLPNSISFEEAVCLPIAYVTAWSMLTRKARLEKGEWVLIQAGGSGVSVAAIQMAKLLGATVITTVGSAEKSEKAKALGADHVIEYKTQPFRDTMKALLKSAGRRGVDIAVDHVGKDTFGDSLRSLDWGGRLVTCGSTTGPRVEINLQALFFKNLSILGSTMGSKSDLTEVLSLLEKKKIKAVIDRVFQWNELPQAHAYLESRKAFGKVVLRR